MLPELHLKSQDYQTLPWKTGSGATDEVWLWPPEATRDAFSIRVSRAPITSKGTFSSFPGADRIITLIEGHALSLTFEEDRQELRPFAPFRFDTGRAPIGDPHAGPVKVFNVMAKREDWRFSSAVVAERDAEFSADLAVVFTLEPQRITTTTGQFALAAQDTFISPETGRTGGRALVVSLDRR